MSVKKLGLTPAAEAGLNVAFSTITHAPAPVQTIAIQGPTFGLK